MGLISLLVHRLWLFGSLHGGKKLNPDHGKLLGISTVEPLEAQRNLAVLPNRIQSRRGSKTVVGDSKETKDDSLQLRCYKCQRCADVQRLLFVGSSKSRDDVNEQYNALNPAAKLIQQDCEASFFQGKYVVVQYLYETWKADKWQREFDWGYPVAACFDNSYVSHPNPKKDNV